MSNESQEFTSVKSLVKLNVEKYPDDIATTTSYFVQSNTQEMKFFLDSIYNKGFIDKDQLVEIFIMNARKTNNIQEVHKLLATAQEIMDHSGYEERIFKVDGFTVNTDEKATGIRDVTNKDLLKTLEW